MLFSNFTHANMYRKQEILVLGLIRLTTVNQMIQE